MIMIVSKHGTVVGTILGTAVFSIVSLLLVIIIILVGLTYTEEETIRQVM